jgi:hypothetical protein
LATESRAPWQSQRQRAAAQSSLTDRINLSVAEAFVNSGSLAAVEPTDSLRAAQIASTSYLLSRTLLQPLTR